MKLIMIVKHEMTNFLFNLAYFLKSYAKTGALSTRELF
jgi:hypothetical protein